MLIAHYTGDGPPSSDLGPDGASYRDALSQNLYRRDAGAWLLGVFQSAQTPVDPVPQPTPDPGPVLQDEPDLAGDLTQHPAVFSWIDAASGLVDLRNPEFGYGQRGSTPLPAAVERAEGKVFRFTGKEAIAARHPAQIGVVDAVMDATVMVVCSTQAAGERAVFAVGSAARPYLTLVQKDYKLRNPRLAIGDDAASVTAASSGDVDTPADALQIWSCQAPADDGLVALFRNDALALGSDADQWGKARSRWNSRNGAAKIPRGARKATQFVIGQDVTGAAGKAHVGDVRALVVFRPALSPFDEARWRRALAARYGLPQPPANRVLNRPALGKQTFAETFAGWTGSASKKPGSWRTLLTWGNTSLNNEDQGYVPPETAGYEWTHENKPGLHTLVARRVVPPKDERIKRALTWSSSCMTTEGLFQQQFGFFEARMRTPGGKGAWPAFWMIPADLSWPPEIDVQEGNGAEPCHMWCTLHPKSGMPQRLAFVPNVQAGMHDYGFLWTPERCVWTFDGYVVADLPNDATLNKEMILVLNLAVGGDWFGHSDATTPAELRMEIERVGAWGLRE